MATNQNKTVRLKQTPRASFERLPKTVRDESISLLKLFEKATRKKGYMWGSMVGFGEYDYTYASGRSGTWFATGFAIRKTQFTIYSIVGYKKYPLLLKKIGRHKVSGSCLHFKKLSDIDVRILSKLIVASLSDLKRKYVVR